MEDLDDYSWLRALPDIFLRPIRPLISKPARRAYLTTLIFILSSLLLLVLAVCAYLLFYLAYIPSRGFTLPIHLQFPTAQRSPGFLHVAARAHPPAAPHADLAFPFRLASNQPYDFSLRLDMPRTPANLAAGNFMLDLRLTAAPPSSDDASDPPAVLRARRPAIMTYRSPSFELLHALVRLPLLLTGWQRESEALTVPMATGVRFGGSGGPAIARGARVAVEGSDVAGLQIYSATLRIDARYEGLRWVMCRWRITSFVMGTGMFWGVEMAVFLVAWVTLVGMFGGEEGEKKVEKGKGRLTGPVDESEEEERSGVKREEGEESDPSPLARWSPGRYRGIRIKKEDDDDEDPQPFRELVDAPEGDEDFDEGHVVLSSAHRLGGRPDSGQGTSLESDRRRESMRRRLRTGE